MFQMELTLSWGAGSGHNGICFETIYAVLQYIAMIELGSLDCHWHKILH